jgi:hypothetical protein
LTIENEKKFTSGELFLLGTVFSLSAGLIVFVAWGISSTKDDLKKFREQGIVTGGKITGIEKNPALHSGWTKEYEYFVKGKRYTGMTSEPIYEAKVGDSVDIIYLPADPGNSTFLNEESEPENGKK